MKTFYFLLVLTYSTISAKAQSHVEWTTPEITPGSQVNLYNGSNADQLGNTYTIHFTQDPVNHYFTYRFFSYNNAGIKQWQYDNDSCFTNCQDIYSIIVPIDNDGALFIGYHNDLTGPWEIRIKRIGATGNLVWQQNWTQYFAAYPVSALIDNAGNLVVALNAYVNNSNDKDFAFAKFDLSNGNNIWHYEIPDAGLSGTQDEEIASMIIDNANNIYGCGIGGMKHYYFKVSNAGALDYEFIVQDDDSISTINTAGVRQILLGENNDLYLLAGSSSKGWLQKYEASSGNFILSKGIAHDSSFTKPVSFVLDNNYIYAVSNYNYFIPDTNPWIGGHFTNMEYMITKIDTGGTIIWEHTFLENLDSAAQETGSGGASQMLFCNGHLYVLSAAVTDSLSNLSVVVLNKIDAAGNISWYDIEPADFGSGDMAADNNCNIYVSRSVNPGGLYLHVITQKFTDNLTAAEEFGNKNDDWTIFPNPASELINNIAKSITFFIIFMD